MVGLLEWQTAASMLEEAGHLSRDAVRESGSQHSESERWEADPEHLRTVEFYRQCIGDRTNCHVLDLGAGAGKIAIRLAGFDNVTSIVAYDYSLAAMAPLVDGVRRRIPVEPVLSKIRFCNEGAPWHLPFETECFDVAVCRYAMHHFSDQAGAVAEMWRCLRTGGLLLYSDPAMPEHSKDTTQALYVLREENFHGYRTYHEMIDLVSSPGFQIISCRPYDYQRGTLAGYLQAADPALRPHLTRAWCNLDERTKKELRWPGHAEGKFITYPILDIAAQRI